MKVGATVFIVDDDPHVRKLLAAEIESAGLRAEAFASGEDFLAGYSEGGIGCVLLDLRLSGMSGLSLLETLRLRRLAVPVIMISAFGDVPAAVDSMKLGAIDFLQKPFAFDDLIAKVRAALEKDAARREREVQSRVVREHIARLSPREGQLLKLLAEGKSSKMIAHEMGLAVKTVENHRAHLLAKTQARNVADLVRMSMLADVQ